MKQLDEILMTLQDSAWHDCSGIQKSLAVSKEDFRDIIQFLQNQQMLELKNDSIRITSKGKKFLDLSP